MNTKQIKNLCADGECVKSGGEGGQGRRPKRERERGGSWIGDGNYATIKYNQQRYRAKSLRYTL